MYSLDKENHHAFDEFEETILTEEGTYRTVGQKMNAHKIKIRMSCASCAFATIGADNTKANEGTHFCAQTEGRKPKGHTCNGWKAKEVYEKAGSKEIPQGRVQTADFIHWRVANESRISDIYEERYPKTDPMHRPDYNWFIHKLYHEMTGQCEYYNPDEK